MVFDALALYAGMPAVNEDHKKSMLLKSVCLIYVSYICSTLVYKQKKWNFCVSNIKRIIEE